MGCGHDWKDWTCTSHALLSPGAFWDFVSDSHLALAPLGLTLVGCFITWHSKTRLSQHQQQLHQASALGLQSCASYSLLQPSRTSHTILHDLSRFPTKSQSHSLIPNPDFIVAHIIFQRQNRYSSPSRCPRYTDPSISIHPTVFDSQHQFLVFVNTSGNGASAVSVASFRCTRLHTLVRAKLISSVQKSS